jgi:hypothetical protein
MTLHSALLDPDTHGNAPLWRVFWIEGVLLSHVLFGAIVLSYRHFASPALALMLLGFLLYTAWIMRRVWVNADNVSKPEYGSAARYLTVAWAINAVLMSGFMLLAHLSGEKFPLPF